MTPSTSWPLASLMLVLGICAGQALADSTQFKTGISGVRLGGTGYALRYQNETLALRHAKGATPPKMADKLELQAVGQREDERSYKLFKRTDGSRKLAEISATAIEDDERIFRASSVVLFNKYSELKQYSLGELLLMGLVAMTHSSVYNVAFQHRYDNYQDMRRAVGPGVNKDVCIRQLENMATRVANQQRDGYMSKDPNIYQIADTWARAPPDFVLGDFFIEGSYRECVRNKLGLDDGSQADMRYCVLSVKSRDWPQLDKYDLLDIKAGICIPKACDSSNQPNKYELISRIAASQLRPMERDRFIIKGLYCLPDEESPLRSIRHSPKARITAGCLVLWTAVLVYATYKYNWIQERLEKRAAGQMVEVPSESATRIYRMLSITNNMRLLFNTTKASSLTEAGSEAREKQPLSADEKQVAPDAPRPASEPARESPVDLSCIEGIKVIAMCYVIMGHVIMCMPTILNNGRDLAEEGFHSVAFFIANLVPAFAVNSFFMITGLLTCYLMFKQNKSQSIITSPGKWAALMLYRYLRIMPMYAIVVLYCKHLARYTSSGPLWDYGTSALSQRRVCEQEPWTYTLTFTSNFLPPMRHCIPGGWYLSNDIQFLLVTPIFMIALHARPRLGKALLYLGILAGYIAGFRSIYSSSLSDLRPIAMFLPFGFKTYVSHLSYNYTHPQYRIPAYLVGLLVGYLLYEHEEKQRRHARLSEAERSRLPAPGWSAGFRARGAWISAILILISCATPIVGRLLPFNKAMARIMVAFITPSYHLSFAVSIGIFLMLATTGHANKPLTRLLANRHWKPFARLSLCAVLVNVEVINYIIQSNTYQQQVNNAYILVLNASCIALTYLTSTVVCVLFESPIRTGLNALLVSLMRNLAGRQKQKTR